MDRRTFLFAAAAAVTACSRSRGSGDAGPAGPAGPPIGLQLYTVRGLMADDLAATLQLVADVGYREVEFAGYFGLPPGKLRGLLIDAGLRAPSAHIGYDQFAQSVGHVIEHALAMGHHFVVVPAVPDIARATLDDYLRHADNFNRWAEACRAAGLRFAYHNHEFEFDRIDGEVPYDILLSRTDADNVEMELDLAWARGGNADPIGYFRAWPGRFPLCHVKDYDDTRGEVDIGEGDVPFESIFDHAQEAGLQHAFVERDRPADAQQSIRRNFDAATALWSRRP